jgi:adenine-specific DNA-methyltransferase
LNYTHKGKIDVIYIDPPYNTGNKDFTYNDNYVDGDDSFRHSKWLSFMNARLNNAKDLLNDRGVIFISIDDHEQANLKILCDEIFGSNNFINTIIWQRASGGGNAKGIVTGHDYILVYQKNANTLIDYRGDKIDKGRFSSEKIKIIDGKEYFLDDDIVRKVFGKYEKGVERRCYYEELEKYKSPTAVKDIKSKVENGEYILIKQKNGKHFIGKYKEADTTKKMYSIIQGVLNNQGKEDLEKLEMENDIFSYPKPVKLLSKLFSSIPNNSITVLDFFAGSGTTGHAVLGLNKQDGGNRKFILCTNNENKIAENVTYERLKRVIKGYKNKKGEKVEGLGSNLSYFKTDLVDIEKLQRISDESKIKITYQAGEMIALRENTLNESFKNDWWQIFENDERKTAIYFKEDKSKLSDLVNKIEKENKPTTLYIFGWGKNEYKNEYSSTNIKVEDIPEPIIEVYKEINRI